MKIGDRIYVRGYVDEIRKDTVIVRNDGGYFGTILSEVTGELSSAQPEIIHCRDCKHRGEKPIADGRYWCEIHDTFMYYCSDAERRTDEWMGNS